MVQLTTSLLLSLTAQTRSGGVIVNEHTLTADQVRRHVEVLGRWFDFICLDELPLRLTKPARRRFCLLTFDDGKRSHFTEVAPELERLGVPAVFYVPTEFLSNGEPLWFDRRAALVRAIGRCPAGLELESLKQLPLAELTERLDHACAKNGFQWEDQPEGDERPMSWDNARDLARRGFTVGAHGVTHAILTRETKEHALAEIEQSLEKVSSELGTQCRTFAFPNGNYNPELTQHAQRCGATTVMTTEPMWTDIRSSMLGLPRIQLFGTFTPAQIELKLALAAAKGALANPDGTGRTYRFGARQQRGMQQTQCVSVGELPTSST